MKQQTHSQEQQLEAMNTCMHKPSQVSNEEIEHSNGHIDTPVGLKINARIQEKFFEQEIIL